MNHIGAVEMRESQANLRTMFRNQVEEETGRREERRQREKQGEEAGREARRGDKERRQGERLESSI
jgi:hypothetical protein